MATAPSLSFSLLPISKPPSTSLPFLSTAHPIALKKRSSSFTLRYSPPSPSSSFSPTTVPLTGLPAFDSEPDKWDPSRYEALLRGGEQVTSVLEEMITLLEDMEMDSAAAEAAAVEIAAQGVIGKRVDEMESGFMMALDYMIQIADKDKDDQRKLLLEVIKQTVLDHLTKKCPPHVQVIGLLCRTPQKESRHELLRRVAAGGGVFNSENSLKVQLPAANLNDIANQADDLLETMESRPTIPDRKLLARLVLIREEARNMMGGGLLDERNDRGLSTLPEAEVNFLSKLVTLRPGKPVKEMINDVMLGKNEGADPSGSNDEDSTNAQQRPSGIAGRCNWQEAAPCSPWHVS